MKDEHIISLLLGIISISLAIVTLVNPAMRLTGTLILGIFVIIIFYTLKIQQIKNLVLQLSNKRGEQENKIKEFLERFDVHKKIYKIENELKNMRRGRKGSIDPLWGVVAVAFIILIVFILLAAGVISLT